MKQVVLSLTKIKGSVLIALMFVFFNGKAQNLNSFLTNPEVLKMNLRKVAENDIEAKNALSILQTQGLAILNKKPKSVVDKTFTPPSGSKHDFYSLAGYYWPNPKKANGLPYIHKDGKWNPEASKIKDRSFLHELCRDVRVLGVLFYYTKDEKYAEKAKEFLLTWFINDRTKMNPNLNFAQAVRGVTDGRSTGLVDTRELVDLLDGVQLLVGSKAWTNKCNDELKVWFKDYLNWMLNSKLGKGAELQTNNIGTAYLAQTVCFALYTDQPKLAFNKLQSQVPKLLDEQFDTEGKQPLELKRNDAWMYSNSNLNQWIRLLQMSKLAKFDLWNYNYTGKSIEKGYYWLSQFANGEKSWKYGKKEGIDLKNSFQNNQKRVEVQRMGTQKASLSTRKDVASKVGLRAVSKSDSNLSKKISSNDAIYFLTETGF